MQRKYKLGLGFISVLGASLILSQLNRLESFNVKDATGQWSLVNQADLDALHEAQRRVWVETGKPPRYDFDTKPLIVRQSDGTRIITSYMDAGMTDTDERIYWKSKIRQCQNCAEIWDVALCRSDHKIVKGACS